MRRCALLWQSSPQLKSRDLDSRTIVEGGFMAEQGVSNSLDALSRQLAAAVERVSPAVVAVDARPRVKTSGVIWRAGVVVSTNHTVRRDEEITITLHDGHSVQATLAGRDPSTDLAVLRYESGAAGEETVAETSDGAGLKVGHLVLA